MENKSSTCHMTNEKRLSDVDVLIRTIMDIHSAHYDITYEGIIRLLKDAPTVDAVEVVHGQWLDGYAVDHNGKEVYKSIDCSVCNDIFKVETEDREYWKNRFKVCPFCGALMDGGNEDV